MLVSSCTSAPHRWKLDNSNLDLGRGVGRRFDKLKENGSSLLLIRLISSLRICSNQAFNRTIFYNRKFGSTK